VQALFSADGAQVASVGTDRLVRLWDLGSGQERDLPDAEYSGRGSMATLLGLSADGRLVAGAGGGAAHVWRLDSGEARAFQIDGGLPRSVSFSPDSGTLAVAGTDGNIRLWELASNRERRLGGHEGDVLNAQFSPTERKLASIGVDRTVRLWDLASATGRVLGTVAAEPTPRLVFAHDGRNFATATASGEIDLWNVGTQPVRALRGHGAAVSALAFSGDGHLLASSSLDHTARVWNLTTGAVRTLRSHEEPVRSVAITPDGSIVATASNDRTVRLWNLENDGIAILRGHRAAVRSVRFSSDGSKLVSASEDGTVRIWNMSLVRFVPGDRRVLKKWLRQETSATLPPLGEEQ
jgi:WD40 repeat protein